MLLNSHIFETLCLCMPSLKKIFRDLESALNVIAVVC